MPTPIKILIAEDNPADAELVLREFRRAGFNPDWQRVETEPAFLAHLHSTLDLVMSDYQMPQFSGFRALELLKQSGLEIPFILVSGTIGEDTAVAAMKNGAADYFLKDRLARLGTAVTHALAAYQLRREHRAADAALRRAHAQLSQLFEQSPAVLYALKLQEEKIVPYMVSENIMRFLGFTVAESLSYDWWLNQLHDDDRERAVQSLAEATSQESSQSEYRMRHKDGHYCWIHDARRLVRDEAGEPAELTGVWTSIDERKQSEEKIKSQLSELLRWQEVMLNRENRVDMLKAEVNAELVRQGRPPRYASSNLA